jgi:hypothetical protein
MASKCNFVRKNCEGWEFGFIQIDNYATPRETRTHVVVGKAPTYEDALAANAMAVRGKDRVHHFDHNAKPLWKER